MPSASQINSALRLDARLGILLMFGCLDGSAFPFQGVALLSVAWLGLTIATAVICFILRFNHFHFQSLQVLLEYM